MSIEVSVDNNFERWITPAMQQLVDDLKVIQPDLKLHIDLVPAGYYSTYNGIFGYTGSTGVYNDIPPKVKVSENLQTLTTLFTVSTSKLEEMKPLLDQLRNSPGGRNNVYPAYTIIPHTYSVEKKMGWYEKDLFENVYQAYLKSYPEMTRLELASERDEYGDLNFDSLLVEQREYTGPEGCLEEFNVHESHPTDSSSVLLHVISTDLKVNHSTILDIVKLI